EIPVIIKDYSEQEIVEVSLIENIQREDLNPIEEARAYQRLLQEFDLKQEDVAQRVSKNRTTITNSLRLLKLNTKVQDMLAEGTISSGHARALLGIEDPDAQLEIANRVVEEKLSVRDIERLMRTLANGRPQKKEKEKDLAFELACRDMEEKMKATLGTKVTVNFRSKNKGRIEIEYYSQDELERLYELLRSLGR
ncbi:MAG: ParB/RepB/Spo0J family partition protein, partial [Lachnospiraceae bacterium]|nr:ParB/RepB/Spo0J family partition protein [Lachnospiraceae bacterium]